MHQLYRQFARRSFAAAIVLIALTHTTTLGQQIVEGVIRIKVNESLAGQLEQQRFSRRVSGEVTTGVPSLDRLSEQFQVRRFTRVFPYAGKDEARHRKHGLHLWYEVALDRSVPVSHAIQSYQSDKQILRAEPVYQKQIIGAGRTDFGPRVVNTPRSVPGTPLPDAANDPLLATQWHYNNTGQSGGTPGADIRLFDAWKVETGDPEVIVAVVDGGVQTDHPDLAPNMWVNPGETPKNKIDDDNNGYVDDVHGYGFINHSPEILPHDHGTHIAGTLAAVSNNGIGVSGIAGGSGNGDGIRVMSCAVFTNDSMPDGFAQAYVYAADNGAVISQSSWGYTLPGVFEQVVLDAIDYFIEEAGRDESGKQTGLLDGGIAIFSAGNANDEGNYYPAYYEPVLAVASTTHADKRAYYSNYGTWVDIAAPGGETHVTEVEGVVSTLPGSQYGSFMGTSMACPHVAGVAALIVSKFGKQGFSPRALRARLLQGVDDIYTLNSAYRGKLGTGRLNAVLALQPGDAVAPDAITDLSVVNNEAGAITLTWTSPQAGGDIVTEYDLRYSNAPITETNFGAATRAEGVPEPKAPGLTEEFTLKHLPGGTLFYFAIRSVDFEGNVSPLSNVVSETSALTPSMVVRPRSITVPLKTGDRASRNFTVTNEGEGVLEFSIATPSEDDFASASPSEGTVQPGASQRVSISFDASEKMAGTYRQDVTFTSNDPERSQVNVALTMRVEGNGAPIASVAPDTVDFKRVQLGRTLQRKIDLANAGSEPLVVSNVSSDNAAFRAAVPLPITLEAFEHRQITIVFAPRETGPASGTIELVTNDPDHPLLLVHVSGEGSTEAPFTVTPTAFAETLEAGTRVLRTLTLRNEASEERQYHIEAKNHRLVVPAARIRDTPVNAAMSDSAMEISRKKLEAHQQKMTASESLSRKLVMPLLSERARPASRSGRQSSDKTTAYTREVRTYGTGFEEFTTGWLGEQNGWFSTQSWNIAQQNPRSGNRHLRGESNASGTGEKYCLSPYLFEYEEFYYPQYTTAMMQLNLDNAGGTTWEVVPQDPWSFVATRIRFNPDKTIDVMVVDSDYESHWKRVPERAPSGYFELAIEYNNAGSDTSGFPTWYLFVNSRHVYSGTGLASGIGQVALASPMETSGPVIDVDEFHLIGAEYIPAFVNSGAAEGTVPARGVVNIPIEFDASIMKPGSYESDLVVYLDEVDSVVVPVSLTVPGAAAITRDLQSVFWVLEKHEQGKVEMTLKNTGGKPATFALEYDLPGLSITPESGTLGVRQEEVIEIDFNGPPDIYEDEIILRTNTGSSPEIVPVTIIKMDSGAVFDAPDTVEIEVPVGQVSTRTFQIQNKGVNTVSFTAEVLSHLNTWVGIDPSKAKFTRSMDLTLTIDGRDVAPGMKSGNIRFRTNDSKRRNANTQVTITFVADTSSRRIIREQWDNVPGTLISSIPVEREPSSSQTLTLFESPSNIGDNYGARIRGFITVPLSGEYRFWIASNDRSELWLSTDADPRNKKRIASVPAHTNPRQWNKYPVQQSAILQLQTGKRYYIEALHKEGIGTDHLSVGWQLPDGTLERPMSAVRLIPYLEGGPICVASGSIAREYWANVEGTRISDIPLNTPANGVGALTSFEGPPNSGTNYGARISGFICPPQTGEYYFWISSNDHSELWIGTDERVMSKRKIASVIGATERHQWNKFSSQKSQAVFLVAGKTYYIEALHKQGIGTDHIAVGWQLPDGTMERPIAGSHLSPAAVGFKNHTVASTHQVVETGGREVMTLDLFPNPVNAGELNVRLNGGLSDENADAEVIIRELTGLSVYTERIDCAAECSTLIDLKGKLRPGVYIFQFNRGKETYTEKLIVK